MTRSSPGRRRPSRSSWRRSAALSPRLRRLLAACLVAVSVTLLARAALGRPAPGDVEVVVPARDVPAGATLRAADVQLRHLPPRAVPPGAITSVREVPGRTAAVPLTPGRALVPDDLHAAALVPGPGVGGRAVYLPLGEPAVAASLVAGDRVDVHSPVDGSVVVPAALVLRVVTQEQPGLWVAVEEAGAVALAAARGADPLGSSLQVSLLPSPAD